MTFIYNSVDTSITPTQNVVWDNLRQYAPPQYIPCISNLCSTTIQIGVKNQSPPDIFSYVDTKVVHIQSKKIFNIEADVISCEKGKIKNFDRTQID